MSGTTYPTNPAGQKLKKVGDEWSAYGHFFDENMICHGCGITYAKHQQIRERCIKPKGDAVLRPKVP